MAQKKGYSRLFIILQEYDKGYGLSSDKSPNGYVKIEMKSNKCKINFYVQNLKNIGEDYNMLLVCDRKAGNKLINLGKLKVETGKADIVLEYPVENIAKTGVAMDKICGTSIGILRDGKLSSVMCGFATRDIPENWLSFEVLESATDEKQEPLKQEEKKIQKKQQVIEVPLDKQEPIDTRGDDEEEEPKEKDEEESKEEIEEPIVDDLHYDFEGYERSIPNEAEKGDYPRGSMGEFFNSLVENYDEMKDFFPELKRTKWHKIPVNNIEDMYSTNDYKKYTTIYYPMLNNYPYISKHGHYIVGYKSDKNYNLKYIVYGVPGKKKIMDQPFGGKTGYVMWIPNDKNRDSEDDLGYWLMFYDFMNATIVIPMED